MQNNEPNAQNTITLKIIWIALFISQILYLSVVIMTSKNTEVESRLFDLSDPLTMPFATMAVVALVAAFTLPKFLSSKTSKASQPDAMKRFFVPFIIRLAILESVTLYGFVIALLRHDPKRMLAFMCVSMIGFILSFPTDERVEAGF